MVSYQNLTWHHNQEGLDLNLHCHAYLKLLTGYEIYVRMYENYVMEDTVDKSETFSPKKLHRFCMGLIDKMIASPVLYLLN
jgi:hypothetical protein